MVKEKNFFIVSSVVESLVLFRGELIQELVSRGFNIQVLAPNLNQKNSYTDKLNSWGVRLLNLPIVGAKISLLRDIYAIFVMIIYFLRFNPHYVLSYNLKPVLLSNLICWIFKTKKRFIIITGLGYFFLDHKINSIATRIIKIFYNFTLKRASKIFFQNQDDMNLFKKMFKIPSNKTVLTNGSGVNIDYFKSKSLPKEKRFLMIARLIKAKGVKEYLLSAQIIKKKYPFINFNLVGFFENNIDSINKDFVESFVNEGVLNFLGKLEDVRDEISNSSIFVLPSYREGMPRTVLEAMSVGRPIITSNVPGCKDTVKDGVNGFLIEPKSIQSLVHAMEKMINLDDVALSNMGKQSRLIAEQKYDVNKVNKNILSNFFNND